MLDRRAPGILASFTVGCLLVLSFPSILQGADDVKPTTRKWASKTDFQRCTADGSIEIADDGTVRLRKTVLLQDEQGMTHYENTQNLSETVWAKKQFMIDDPACAKAELLVFGTAARVTCNNHELKEGQSLPSTSWVVWNVPVKALKRGLNEFVFSDGGGLLVESSLSPNRSAVSSDGGKTWDFDRLGVGGVENGEWVARLRLAQYPKAGTITSEPVDLADASTGIPFSGKIASVQAKAKRETLSSSSIVFEVRTGATPTPDLTWSSWKPAGAKMQISGDFKWQRWVQWRATLAASPSGRTPQLGEVELIPSMKKMEDGHSGSAVKIIEITPVQLQRGSWPFAYQDATNVRLKLLRSRYKLDELVAPGKTELEKLVLLRNWVRYTAPKAWDGGTTQWCPPWDALVILETSKKPIALCMCTHFSTVFVQCAAALGYNARHLILDHHCATEIWSNQFGKWMVMDPGNSAEYPNLNCHFEKEGIPLNAVEIHNLWKADRISEIEAVYTSPARRVRGQDLSKDQCGFVNYRRFGVPFRNNHMATPFPGEVMHGESNYYCDAYLWWEDHAVPTESPEYGKTTCRPADYYWTLNETAIALQASDTADTLTVMLDTVTPNFEKFLVSVDGGTWEPKEGSFTWKLHSDENKLQVKSVNQFGVEGNVSLARVKFTPVP